MDQQNIDDFCDLVIDHLKNSTIDISENEKFKSRFNNMPMAIVSGKSKNDLINNLLEVSSFDTYSDRANFAIILKALPPDRSQSTGQSFILENHAKKNKTPVSVNRQNLKFRSNNSTLGLEDTSDGSPLKLRAYADLSDFDSTCLDSPVFVTKKHSKHRECGIPARHARYLLSMYSNGLSQKCLYDKKTEPRNGVSNMPSLAILCDAKDLKKIACLCVEPLVRKNENDNLVFVGIRSTIITVQRSSKTDDIPPVVEDLSGRQINYQAQYDIFGGGRDDKFQTEYRGSLILELKWNKSGDTVTLLKQPPLDAQSVVKAQVTSGDMRSAAYVFFKELSVLSSIVSGINDAEVCWHTDRNERPLVECVKELVEQLKMGDARPATEMEQNGNNLSLVFENLLFETRKDLDFTDYLWQVLQKCSAYTELVECLECVLTVLDSGELQPMVHKTNTTTLARLVRDSYEGKMNKPCLVGLFPLQVLAEIGIKKLRHDYINTFVSNELATLAHLDKYILPDKTTPLSTSLESLEKLHNVLEMVTMLKLFIKIPHATLSSIVRQMLKHYESNCVDESHVFTFPVPTESVAEILKNSPPCMWKMSAVKMVDGFSDNISYTLSSKQPFLHLPPGEQIADISCTKDSDSDIQYYSVKRQDNVAVLI